MSPDLDGSQTLTIHGGVAFRQRQCIAQSVTIPLTGTWSEELSNQFPWLVVILSCIAFIILCVAVSALIVFWISERERAAAELQTAKDMASFEHEQNERHVTRTRYVLHELKQPFASVVMGLDQMDETLVELQQQMAESQQQGEGLDQASIEDAREEMESTVRIMRSSSVAMHHIITDVLLMAQIEAQGLQLKMRPCTLASSIRSALVTLIHQAEEGGVTMRLSFYDCREQHERTRSLAEKRAML